MMIWSRWGCFYKNEDAWLSLIVSKKNIFNMWRKERKKTGQSFQWDTSSWGRRLEKCTSLFWVPPKDCMFTFPECTVTDVPSCRLGGDLNSALKARVTHHANTQSQACDNEPRLHLRWHPWHTAQKRFIQSFEDCKNILSVYPSGARPLKIHFETPRRHLQSSRFSVNLSSRFETSWSTPNEESFPRKTHQNTDPSVPSETWESDAAGGSGRIHGLVRSKMWLCLLTQGSDVVIVTVSL